MVFSQPFPWRYNKRTQEIDLDFVDGFTNSTSLNDSPMFFRGSTYGGAKVVLGLGAKFIQWCETTLTADAGTVSLYENPYVVNANMLAPKQNPNDAETSGGQTYPISFEDSAGSSQGKYCKTLVFMKPMVITYLISGTRYYRWFSQNFEGNT